jgi:hypothetical protein
MSSPAVTWAGALQAVSGAATPILVLIFAWLLNRKLGRNQELTKSRLAYYSEIIGPLNDLMCYFTYIGRWRDISPPDVIRIKRELDRTFYCAAPLFSPGAWTTYNAFKGLIFDVSSPLEVDALLRTGFERRKAASQQGWNDEWIRYFKDGENHLDPTKIKSIRENYNKCVSSLVRDVNMTRPRTSYTTSAVHIEVQAEAARLRPLTDVPQQRQKVSGVRGAVRRAHAVPKPKAGPPS